ncbi:MAG: thiamine-phosphate kinase [Phycisphaerales bacterium]
MRELELLAHIYKANPALPGAVSIPPGDDMGAVVVGGVTLLVTVDQVADGVHFELGSTPLEKIGRKAITRNLSDVAAMAAKPVGAAAAACLPKGFAGADAMTLFDAMRATAEAFGCPLIGGDISAWDQRLILTVTVFAEPGGVEPVTRNTAKAGDGVYVTGALGGSLIEMDNPSGYVHHLDFTPRIALARKLAADETTRPHAMIDLSDGLAQDLTRICERSGVRAQIECDKLPVSPAARLAAQRSGQPAWRHALGDGEDYELCFTAPEGVLSGEIDGVPITMVGRILAAGPGPVVGLLQSDGTETDVAGLGWEHTG